MLRLAMRDAWWWVMRGRMCVRVSCSTCTQSAQCACAARGCETPDSTAAAQACAWHQRQQLPQRSRARAPGQLTRRPAQQRSAATAGWSAPVSKSMLHPRQLSEWRRALSRPRGWASRSAPSRRACAYVWVRVLGLRSGSVCRVLPADAAAAAAVYTAAAARLSRQMR